MDPQQRLLLDAAAHVLHAVRTGGTSTRRNEARGSFAADAVFVGMSYAEYAGLAAVAVSAASGFTATGGALSVAAGACTRARAYVNVCALLFRYRDNAPPPGLWSPVRAAHANTVCDVARASALVQLGQCLHGGDAVMAVARRNA